jgi:hypothetical protein
MEWLNLEGIGDKKRNKKKQGSMLWSLFLKILTNFRKIMALFVSSFSAQMDVIWVKNTYFSQIITFAPDSTKRWPQNFYTRKKYL